MGLEHQLRGTRHGTSEILLCPVAFRQRYEQCGWRFGQAHAGDPVVPSPILLSEALASAPPVHAQQTEPSGGGTPFERERAPQEPEPWQSEMLAQPTKRRVTKRREDW